MQLRKKQNPRPSNPETIRNRTITEVALIIDTAIWGPDTDHVTSAWINNCAEAIVNHVETALALDVVLEEAKHDG